MILSTVLVKKGAKINIKKIIDKHFFYVIYYTLYTARARKSIRIHARMSTQGHA